MSIFGFLNRSTEDLLEACDVSTRRGSGPGGRKADTTESTVRLSHDETGLSVSVGKTRSQQKNRQLAVRELKIKYALEKRHRLRTENLTVPGSLTEYVQNGLRIKRNNPHFPFMVKLVLDLLFSCEGRLSEVADHLGVSTNRLSGFIKDHPAVLEQANQIRGEHGHHEIK